MTSRLSNRAAPVRSRTATAPPAVPLAGTLAHEVLDVALGRRVLVVGDLLLDPVATPSSLAAVDAFAAALDDRDGPAIVVVSGSLFARPLPRRAREEAVLAHPAFLDAVRRFTRRHGRVVLLAGWRDVPAGAGPAAPPPSLVLAGAEHRSSVDLRFQTTEGRRTVAVRAGAPAAGGPVPGPAVGYAAAWLDGGDRLENPHDASRFVASRTLYRRLARFGWLLFLPAALAGLLRLPRVIDPLDRLVGPSSDTGSALSHAYGASWDLRFAVTATVTLALVGLLALVHVVVSRRVWRALGGGPLPRRRIGGVEEPRPTTELDIDGDDATEAARALVAAGADGAVVGGGLRPELTHLHPGFVASPGALGDIVRELPGRLGLPPVFVAHRQVAWLELEARADVRVRLVATDGVAPGATATERLCASGRAATRRTAGPPAVVAAWPQGTSWPEQRDGSKERWRTRLVRRMAAVAVLTAGVADLLAAAAPPRPDDLHAVEQWLSLGGVVAARALTAFAAVALLFLARGLLRGQRRAWVVSVGILSGTVLFRLAGGSHPAGLALSVVLLGLLIVERRRFCAAVDHRSWRSAVATIAGGGVLAVVGTFLAVEVAHVRGAVLPRWPLVLAALAERLAGLRSVGLPAHVDTWVSPSLTAVGCALLAAGGFLATRPVVDRRLSAGRGRAGRRVAELRARDIVRRHGSGSLDYFALRDDKQWFFDRDTLVAYAVHGGVCLVSPDPIGPVSERAHAWTAFRRFADRHGWAVGVVGASETWLPVFRASGMRAAYIGDEAVVSVQQFTLAGNKMKGVRQACSRVVRMGYRAEVVNPLTFAPDVADAVRSLVEGRRRGDSERGFSMTLGRVCDTRDTDLLMTVVYDPAGKPVAVCQFVPSAGIGGYSLDLMRRDRGEHPNGLLDLAVCTAIEHLRAEGFRGLSLNFAAMRASLEGETGNGVGRRVERWAVRRLSSVFQIESLWRFNAKYQPAWLSRYVVFDSAEQFLPTVLNILRAESLSETPVIGRLLSIGDRRSTHAAGIADGRAGTEGAVAPVSASTRR